MGVGRRKTLQLVTWLMNLSFSETALAPAGKITAVVFIFLVLGVFAIIQGIFQ